LTERKQYVVGAVHTNTVEGFWSSIKRCIVGIGHNARRRVLIPLQ